MSDNVEQDEDRSTVAEEAASYEARQTLALERIAEILEQLQSDFHGVRESLKRLTHRAGRGEE